MSTDILTSSSNPGVARRYKAMRDGPTQSYAPTMTPISQTVWRTTFAKNIAAGVDPEWFSQVGALGTGITYNQNGGNLVINSGTTANSELILRSNEGFIGPFELRWQTILSQRITNNNFIVELVDVVGDGLALTVNSATLITVTLPGTTEWSSANVGQSLSVGAVAGVAAAIPGRYPIASVTVNTVTNTTAIAFTVSAWPASGTGTCSLFGWNFHRTLYSGTTATNAGYDCGRRGYASGDTTVTINTTASPGLLNIMSYEGGAASYANQLVSSSTGQFNITQAAARVVNVADETAMLYVQIRCLNGSTAPASTTAWTIGMVSMSEQSTMPVVLTNVRTQQYDRGVPVSITNTIVQQGAGGHGSNIAGSPNRVGARALTAAYTAVATGQTADLIATLQGVLVTRPWQIPELEWAYNAAAGGYANSTTGVTVRSAAGAGLRSYLTSIQIYAQPHTNATEFVLRDGPTGGAPVIWRIFIPTTGLPLTQITFENPLRTTANTLLEMCTLTASGAGAVFFNAQGFTAA